MRQSEVGAAIRRGAEALIRAQQNDGHWCYPLEADCTIPAEYILMEHHLGEIDEAVQTKLAHFIRTRQSDDGGWPLYTGGHSNLSCTVKCYYALKLAGDDPAVPHMTRAREWVLVHGGAAGCNVFTRITLALFGQVPWRAVPFIPVEILLLPEWFPFHIRRVSYWSRTVMVPLFVLTTLKPRSRNPSGTGVRELFLEAPEASDYFPVRSPLNRAFLGLDALGRRLDPLVPGFVRRRALAKAEGWIVERLNGTGGLGAIFPAMVNSVEALAALGRAEDDPDRRVATEALRGLLVLGEEEAFCQPSTSPVWDTALACGALQEVEGHEEEVTKGLRWLADRQLRDEPGDWRESHPDLDGGGWPFQHHNAHYPDLDDTAVIAYVMERSAHGEFRETVKRAVRWIAGMQSRNRGFASFDSDSTDYYLNEIPFADHGALLDPPTSDVSARCALLLGTVARDPDLDRALARCVEFLRGEQEDDGSWFGRWGTNYIYGTWSVLTGLESAGVPSGDPQIRRAVAWLKDGQNEDGGWGESNDSYEEHYARGTRHPSGCAQTAWALLALMAAGERDAPEVQRGIDFLLRDQRGDGLWHDPGFNAPGFPRVFYLKYHGYDKYFPLWALARFRRQPVSS